MTQKISCREILDSLSEYIDAELDPSLCDEIEAHMEGCSPCVAFLNTLKKTVVLYKNCGEDQEVPQEVSIDLQDFLRDRCTETPRGIEMEILIFVAIVAGLAWLVGKGGG